MKPWNNPYFQTECCNCGNIGWSKNALNSFLGARFVCRDGCNPADVAAYQQSKRIAYTNRILKERLLVSDGAGI